MKKLIFLALIFLAGCSSLPSGGNPLLNQPQLASSPCLSQETIDQRLAVLENIAKPVDAISTGEKDPVTQQPYCDENTQCNISPDGTENPGWINCTSAPDRGCTDHPDTANYILVASQIKVPEIVLNYDEETGANPPPTDRQLVKQIFPADHPLRDKIYRPFCGDWCSPVSGAEGFRGTFYCDFVFNLTSEYDPEDPAKRHPADPNLPPDGSVFDVYIREGAPIPDKAKCEADNQQSLTLKDFISQFFDARAQDQNQPIINYAHERWIYVGQEETVKAKDISPNRVNLSASNGLVQFQDADYQVYQDLAARFGPDIIYLTNPGEVEQAFSDYQNDPNDSTKANRLVTFLEFHRAQETKPGPQGLQLGTFLVPIAATWVKDWVFESKPAIYLYPERPTQLTVRLDPAGHLTTSLPRYPDSGWQVTASPDGTLWVNRRRYRYLYYEAAFERSLLRSLVEPDKGFLVPSGQLKTVITPLLAKLGLNDQEITDFVNYWQPRLAPDQTYFVQFLNREAIEMLEPLNLTVWPDTQIRIRTYFKPVSADLKVRPQDLSPAPTRQGFTLVEWGGFLDQ